jgi:type VI secretion system VasD/TssJ family lipoprotein
MRPGSSQIKTLKLNAQTHFVAIVAAFQNIKKARWKGVVEVYPTGYSDIKVHIEKLAVYIEN